MKILRKNIWLTMVIVAFALVIMALILYLFFLKNTFGCNEISNERCVQLFEQYTQTKFPKSGVIIKKDNLCGLNDGWEAVAVEVHEKDEFQTLKKEVISKSFISFEAKKKGIGYYRSAIQKDFPSFDTIMRNNKNYFIVEFIDYKQVVIFEKTW